MVARPPRATVRRRALQMLETANGQVQLAIIVVLGAYAWFVAETAPSSEPAVASVPASGGRGRKSTAKSA